MVNTWTSQEICFKQHLKNQTALNGEEGEYGKSSKMSTGNEPQASKMNTWVCHMKEKVS